MSAQLDIVLGQLNTYPQVIQALRVANEYLGKASNTTSGLDGVFERDAFDAAQSSITQQRGYIKKLLMEIPVKEGPVDARTRDRVATSLKQTERTLALITDLSKDDTSLLEQFLEAMAKILQSVVAPILGGTWKIWVPALIVGVLIYAFTRGK